MSFTTFAVSTPGQFSIEPIDAVGEFFVVDALESQHGGVEIANVNRILYNVVGKIIRFAMDVTFLHAAAGHPHCKATRMMIATVIGFA